MDSRLSLSHPPKAWVWGYRALSFGRPQASSKTTYSFSQCPAVRYQVAWGWTALALPTRHYEIFFRLSSTTKRDFIFSQCFTMFKSTLLLNNKNAIKAKPGCAQTDRRGPQDYHKLPKNTRTPPFSTLHKRGEGCFLQYSISLVHMPSQLLWCYTQGRQSGHGFLNMYYRKSVALVFIVSW